MPGQLVSLTTKDSASEEQATTGRCVHILQILHPNFQGKVDFPSSKKWFPMVCFAWYLVYCTRQHQRVVGTVRRGGEGKAGGGDAVLLLLRLRGCPFVRSEGGTMWIWIYGVVNAQLKMIHSSIHSLYVCIRVCGGSWFFYILFIFWGGLGIHLGFWVLLVDIMEGKTCMRACMCVSLSVRLSVCLPACLPVCDRTWMRKLK